MSIYYLLMLSLVGALLTFIPLSLWGSWLQYFSIPHYGYMPLRFKPDSGPAGIFLLLTFCNAHYSLGARTDRT
ncbi:hypothetical protein SUZIE_130625 [Sciurus carolinensis]|uniref:Uncharacterized protein n=1 Tax=Sciurus carolinensis TaxID=30640 RepID=A0AA41MN05_SCICA|nr:hypothetical protein [Sciurus carolinensis]